MWQLHKDVKYCFISFYLLKKIKLSKARIITNFEFLLVTHIIVNTNVCLILTEKSYITWGFLSVWVFFSYILGKRKLRGKIKHGY